MDPDSNMWIWFGNKGTLAHLVAPPTTEIKSGEKQMPRGRRSLNVSQNQTAMTSWVKHIGNERYNYARGVPINTNIPGMKIAA